MVDAVNRLVGNLLAGAGEVTLPGVGTLRVERRAAQRLSRRRVVPPCRTVVFTSAEGGVSLVERIALAARVDAAKAQEIYDTWRARVSGDHRLTIEGVGELRHKSFVLDPAFDAQLNPQGHAPVQLAAPRRRFDFVLWLGIAAILFVAVFVGYWWKTMGEESLRGRAVASAVAPQAEAGTSGADSPVADSVVDPAVGAAVDPAADPMAGGAAAAGSAGSAGSAVQPGAGDVPPAGGADAAGASAPAAPTAPAAADSAADASRAAIPDGVRTFVSGRRYAVLGVFSSEANARRAVAQAQQSEPSLRPVVYRFGEKFLVSPFDDAEADPCTQFIRAHADRFPGMWTYTAR